jgi:hypothetical protein
VMARNSRTAPHRATKEDEIGMVRLRKRDVECITCDMISYHRPPLHAIMRNGVFARNNKAIGE